MAGLYTPTWTDESDELTALATEAQTEAYDDVDDRCDEAFIQRLEAFGLDAAAAAPDPEPYFDPVLGAYVPW